MLVKLSRSRKRRNQSKKEKGKKSCMPFHASPSLSQAIVRTKKRIERSPRRKNNKINDQTEVIS